MRELEKVCNEGHGVKAVAGMILMMAVTAGCSRAPSDVKRRYLSVPVGLGDRMVKSSLVIACDIRKYDVSFAEFQKDGDGRDELRAARFMSAVGAGDMKTVSALCVSMDAVKAHGELVDDPGSMLRSHWKRIGVKEDLSNLRICDRVYWGRRDIYTYKVDDPNSRYRGVLTFEMDTENGLLWTPYGNDFENVLWEVSPSDYANEQSVDYEYRFTITPAECVEHPVDLLFNGKIPSAEPVKSAPDGSDAAVLFYEGFLNAMKEAKGLEDFREAGEKYFDMYSGKKFAGWLESDHDEVVRWKNGLVGKERKVVFVLDADPVFFVFYHPEGMPEWDIPHDCVIREGDELRMGRLGLEDELCRSLRNREKFVEPFLMSVQGHKSGDSR